MTVYTLDMNTWRCGGGSFPAGQVNPNILGKGVTYLLNEEGYMCCLGQFGRQAGLDDSKLFRIETPMCVDVDGAYDPAFVDDALEDTTLAEALMEINDDGTTTPEEKISLIRATLQDAGHDLVVIPLGGVDNTPE